MIDELMTLDTTGDGYDDSLLEFNENGITVYSDLDYDGNYEYMQTYSDFDEWGNPTDVTVWVDSDNNGIYDTGYIEDFGEYGELMAHTEIYDYDQDGNADMIRSYADTTGDGLFDVATTMHVDNTDSPVIQSIDVNYDLTGDQQSDTSTHIDLIDYTGDGQPDVAEIVITDIYGDQFAYEMPYEEFAYMTCDPGYTTTVFEMNLASSAQFDINTDPDMVIGDPASDMEHWEFQGQTGRCAIYAQKFVIEEALGREIPIEELVLVAEEHGWFNEATGSGTATLNMDKLLEYYGVEHDMSFNNDMAALEEALQDGKNVIVSVDSGQIWYGNDNNIFSPTTQSDHAVQVIGIDNSDPDNPMVVLNDSGTPNGCGELVPLDVFENAWAAGDSQMIIC